MYLSFRLSRKSALQVKCCSRSSARGKTRIITYHEMQACIILLLLSRPLAYKILENKKKGFACYLSRGLTSVCKNSFCIGIPESGTGRHEHDKEFFGLCPCVSYLTAKVSTASFLMKDKRNERRIMWALWYFLLFQIFPVHRTPLGRGRVRYGFIPGSKYYA